MIDAVSYAHETVNVAEEALRQIAISASLDRARTIADTARNHLRSRRSALIVLSQREHEEPRP